MIKLKIVLGLLLLIISNVVFSDDFEGCLDHPMFPDRVPNYQISDCQESYEEVDFNSEAGTAKTVTKEGTKTQIQYGFSFDSKQKKPPTSEILKKYENAISNIKGTIVYLSTTEGIGIFKITNNNKDVYWIKIECGGNSKNDFYVLTILELDETKQEITSADILQVIKKEGRIALDIIFEIEKFDILPESTKIISQIEELLVQNPTLQISIEGHTDNAGSPIANKILSENRAKAIMNVLIAKGIDKSRLMARGWGGEKPISDNYSEEGKSKNRRIEIVRF